MDTFLIGILIMFLGAMGLLFSQVFWNSRKYKPLAWITGIIGIAVIIGPLLYLYLKT